MVSRQGARSWRKRDHPERERENTKEMTVPKKKLTSKQQQLQQAAKNSKKITEFFSKKRPTPPTASLLFSPGEKTAANQSLSLDNTMMDWDENSSADDSGQKETGEDGSFGVDGADDHGFLGDRLEDFNNRDGGGVSQLVLVCSGWP